MHGSVPSIVGLAKRDCQTEGGGREEVEVASSRREGKREERDVVE